jgi:nitrogen-specific signal transduction histidine kinase
LSLSLYPEPTPVDATELPYERLFAAATEPVLVAESGSGELVQANTAAATLLRTTCRSLIGAPLLSCFKTSSRQLLADSVAIACTTGLAEAVTIRPLKGGKPLRVFLSLFRAAPKSYLLVRLASRLRDGSAGSPTRTRSVVFESLERAGAGFLVTDPQLRVQYANQTFIAMVRQSSPARVNGKSLTSWLTLSEVDLVRLREQMAQRQAVSVLTTKLRIDKHSTRDVEVHAVAVPGGQYPCWGFSITPRARLN